MPTGTRKGLNPARTQGQGRNNGGMSTYPIASAYGTNLGLGTPVKLVNGVLNLATNGANAIGVMQGVEYIHPGTGQAYQDKYWPAGTVVTQTPYAKVVDDSTATFTAKANGTVAQVVIGQLFAMDLSAGVDTNTGRDQGVVMVLAQRDGVTVQTGSTNIIATNTGLTTADTFTVRTSAPGAVATTITLVTNETIAQLLAALNAVPNISATLNSSGALRLQATDGYSLILADGTGTPLADAPNFIGAAGTVTATVALNAAMVKVVGVPDTVDNSLEVILANQVYRDNV